MDQWWSTKMSNRSENVELGIIVGKDKNTFCFFPFTSTFVFVFVFDFFVLLEKMSNLESSLEKTKIVHFCFCLFCIVSSLICNSEFPLHSLHFILWTNYRNQSLLRSYLIFVTGATGGAHVIFFCPV